MHDPDSLDSQDAANWTCAWKYMYNYNACANFNRDFPTINFGIYDLLLEFLR